MGRRNTTVPVAGCSANGSSYSVCRDLEFHFTCGWLFTAIPAVICGHIARAKIRKSRDALGGSHCDRRAGFRLHGSFAQYNGHPLLISVIQSDRERLQRLSAERKEIASDDGKTKVIVSSLWLNSLWHRCRYRAGLSAYNQLAVPADQYFRGAWHEWVDACHAFRICESDR